MVSYTVSGGADRSSVANVTVDTPSLIFSLDPLFAMLDFASYPFKNAPSAPQSDLETIQQVDIDGNSPVESGSAEQGKLAFRVNVVQASIKLLADPSRHDSEAIVLGIKQVQMAQQGTFVLSVDHLGIFLCRMDRETESVRILDDFDLNLSMDNRSEDGSQSSSIELDVQPLVLRLSNRDVILVSSIVSRAIELSGNDNDKKEDTPTENDSRALVKRRPSEVQTASSAATKSRRRASSAAVKQKAEVLVTRESVCSRT
jgi:vacuolar protein sorting-associated protein 13A/C